MKIMNNVTAAAGLMAVAILGAFVFSGAACKQSTSDTSGSAPAGIEACQDVVIARVGDADITFGDLIQSPQYYLLFDQALVPRRVISLEAEKYGITADQSEVQARYDALMTERGGYDQFLAAVPPSIPRAIIPSDIRKSIAQELIMDALIQKAFDEQHGPITDEEIQDEFELDKGMYQNLVTNRLPDVEAEDVTVEMARDDIVQTIRNRWIGNHRDQYFQDLIAQYNVENYAAGVVGEMETGETTVPPVTGETFEMEPVEEEEAVQGSTGETEQTVTGEGQSSDRVVTFGPD